MENSYYNHANRAYFLCKSYLFVKFFVIPKPITFFCYFSIYSECNSR